MAVVRGGLKSTMSCNVEMCYHTPTLPLLRCFDGDRHGDNLSPPLPANSKPLPTNPNTAMFAGQDGGQWGGRE